MSDKKFSVLISKENSPPYYIQVPTWVRNFLLYIFPFLFIATLTLTFFNFSTINHQDTPTITSHDNVSEKISSQLTSLKRQISDLESQNMKLRSKVLEMGSNPSSESEALKFNFIKLPQSFKDLSAKNTINLSRWQWDYSNGRAKLSFQLVNKKKSKTQGFLFVIQYTQNGYQVHPISSHSEVLFQKSYLEGDRFNIGFYKPISLKFNLDKSAKSVHYLVIVLSVDGDLLYEKNYGPYQL